MSRERAQEIIREAMQNPDVYSGMAKRENGVWGKILTAPGSRQPLADDAKAAAELRIARNQDSFVRLAKERGLGFEHGLTLGCGAGRFERLLVKAGICSRFHGVDIAAEAVASAREVAAAEGLDISYEVADLNSIVLPSVTYDLVVAQTSLHHVLFLEHVAAQAWACLKPGGMLWIHDYIGETQGQYSDLRLEIVNRVLRILPEEYRKSTVSGHTRDILRRPTPGQLVSPFESIRSEEIIPVFGKWFDIEWQGESNTIMHHVAPPGTRVAFNRRQDSKTILELLFVIDELCLKHNLLQPVTGQYLMRRREGGPRL